MEEQHEDLRNALRVLKEAVKVRSFAEVYE